MEYPVSYIDLRFSIHATEDSERVLKAVRSLFPDDSMNKVHFKETVSKGHYNNPITIYETRIKDTETVEAFVRQLSANLSASDKEVIFRDSNLYVERTNLYMRLDKQAAFEGVIKLRRDDPIYLRLHFQRRDIVETCQKLGLLPK